MNVVGAIVVSAIWAIISTQLALQAFLAAAGTIFGLTGLAAGRMRKADSLTVIGVGIFSVALFLGLLYAGSWVHSTWLRFGDATVQTAAYWFAAATWAFGSMPQLPPKLRNSWRNATVPGSLENDTVARKMGLAPAESRQILAPRLDGGVGHYRVYADVEPPLLVDSDRAYNAHNLLGAYGKSYFWAYRLFWLLMATTFFGGFLSLIWWPWWTPIGGLFLTRVIYGSSKECCADFVRDVVAVNPESRERFAVVGLIRADVPPSAIPA